METSSLGSSEEVSPLERWAEQLGAWAIPEEILAQAPESPWGFPPELFGAQSVPLGALHGAVAEALGHDLSTLGPDGQLPSGSRRGSLLDVGCGGGAASVPLAGLLELLVGVDASAEMLASFAEAAGRAGVVHQEICGQWPEVSATTPVVDVVVCANVAYNVADLAPFVAALSRHARQRVVLEVTAVHPAKTLNPLWEHFWQLERPDGPDAKLLEEVLVHLGYSVSSTTERRAVPEPLALSPERVAFVRRRLCLDPSKEPEVAEVLARLVPEGPSPAERVIFWWDGSAAD